MILIPLPSEGASMLGFSSRALCIVLFVAFMCMVGCLALEAQSRVVAAQELDLLVAQYDSVPAHHHGAVITYIRHVRTIYPCSRELLPISVLDSLTASDITFLDNLADLAYRSGYAQRSCPFPILNRDGRVLYYRAESLVRDL